MCSLSNRNSEMVLTVYGVTLLTIHGLGALCDPIFLTVIVVTLPHARVSHLWSLRTAGAQ